MTTERKKRERTYRKRLRAEQCRHVLPHNECMERDAISATPLA